MGMGWPMAGRPRWGVVLPAQIYQHCDLRIRGVNLALGNPRRSFLADLFHGTANGLLDCRVKSPLNHGEQSAVLFHDVVAQPAYVLPPALHDLLRVARALEQPVKSGVKGFLGLFPGIVFLSHALQCEGYAFHVILKGGVEDLLFLHYMGMKGVGNFPSKPAKALGCLAVITCKAQNAKLVLKFIQQ